MKEDLNPSLFFTTLACMSWENWIAHREHTILLNRKRVIKGIKRMNS